MQKLAFVMAVLIAPVVEAAQYDCFDSIKYQMWEMSRNSSLGPDPLGMDNKGPRLVALQTPTNESPNQGYVFVEGMQGKTVLYKEVGVERNWIYTDGSNVEIHMQADGSAAYYQFRDDQPAKPSATWHCELNTQ